MQNLVLWGPGTGLRNESVTEVWGGHTRPAKKKQQRGARLGVVGKWQFHRVSWAGLTEGRLGKDLKEVSQAELCGEGIRGRGNSQGEAPRLECV